jgi:hypothetical protein
LDKGKDITLGELKSLSSCFKDLNDAKLEPFDILLEEAMAESGLKQYTGVLRLLGIEMPAFIHEYTLHKEWYDMQCSFEHQFSLYAKKAYTDGIGKVEKILDYGDNDQVVIRMGSMQIIVTESRQPFHYEKDFDRLDLKPREADIIVVKLGYLTEELYDMRADWMMAHTRGGVDQELTQLPYQRLERPIYPLDPDMEDPELKVVFL